MFSAPFQIDFDITLECNYACYHCNVSAGEKMSNELTTAEIKKILLESSDIGVSDMSITGGEPLLRNDIREILLYASSLDGFSTLTLNTNGLLITDELIKFFAVEVPKLQVVISLDGYDSMTYSNLRQSKGKIGRSMEDEFSKVVSNLEKLVAAGVSVSVNFTATAKTIGSVFKTYEFVRSIGIKNMMVIKFFPFGFGKINEGTLELDYLEWSRFLIDLFNKKKTTPVLKGLQISVTCPWEVYLPLQKAGLSEEEIEKIWDSQSPLKSEIYRKFRELGCHAGVTNCAISPNGDVYPCGTISTNGDYLVCGNLKNQSLLEIWNESPKLKEIRSLKLADLPKICSSCEISSLCGGGCRSRAYSRCGSLIGPDYLCPIIVESELNEEQL